MSQSETEPQPDNQIVSGWKKFAFLACGGFFFLLGVLGAFLPVLPATPFLLLASYFFVRSSPRLNRALMRSRVIGPILKDYQVHGGVRPDVKIKAIVIVAIAVTVTILVSGYASWTSIAVVVLSAIGVYVIIRLPTARDN